MTIRTTLLAAALSVIIATPAAAAEPAKGKAKPAAQAAAAAPADAAADIADAVCTGKVSGAVTAEFNCVATARKGKGGVVAFEVKPVGEVKGLKSLVPGAFSVKEPIVIQAYTHRDLADAHSSAVTAAGKKFSATEHPGDRGDLALQIEYVELNRGAHLVKARVHSHLVPADAKDKAEVQVDVQFDATW